MAAFPWIVETVGPRDGCVARPARAGGEAALLVVLVEVWGAGARRDELAGRLAGGIAAAFDRQAGGTTARLKAALIGADDWLRRVRAAPGPGSAPADGLGAGASVLVATPREAILAQAGPALAFGLVAPPGEPAAPRPARFPAASPWLRRDVPGLGDHPLWPPLGVPRRPVGRAAAADGVPARPLEIHWASWRPVPGTGILLAPSASAPALSRDVVARLLGDGADAGPAARRPDPSADGRSDLADRVGAQATAVVVWLRAPARPAAQVAPAASVREAGGLGKAPTGALGRPSARSPDAPGPSAGRDAVRAPIPAVPTGAVATWARAIGAEALRLARLALFHSARLGARVVVALFPNRADEGAAGFPPEGTRLAATAALAVPIAVVGMALMMRARLAPASPAAVPAPATAPAALPPAAGDTLAAIARLGDIRPIANLPGGAGDERRLVAAAGVPYVLNVALDQVDRVAGGMAEPVLRKGQPVASDVVGALVDLFWLPPAGNGPEGRVVAMDAAGALWSVNGATVAAVPRAARPGWIGVDQAAGFDGRLYALDRSTGQVYRYAPAGDGAPGFTSDGEPWLAPAQNLSGALDIALDGALYVLDREGRIAKFVSGSAVTFSVEGLRPPLADARSVYASATAGRLLVVDSGNGRIAVLSPEGAFRTQLLRPPQPLAAPPDTGRFADLHDAWWDEPNQLLFVAAGATLYAAGYGP